MDLLPPRQEPVVVEVLNDRFPLPLGIELFKLLEVGRQLLPVPCHDDAVVAPPG